MKEKMTMNDITLMSFGYIYGIPGDADTVIGVRGLPNPYWVEDLKHKTGLDPDVRDYVFSTAEARAYFESCLTLLRQRIAFHEAYNSPLKTPLVVALGCSGGKHRSVSMAIRLAEALEAEGRAVRLVHRDLNKKFVYSAGAVVFTRQAGEPRFVIVEHRDGHHGFPKGRVEPGEAQADAALREVREETGLRVRLLPDFCTAETYSLPDDPNVVKQVIYLLAEYEDQTVVPQESELLSAELLPFEDAVKTLDHESTRRVLREANEYLRLKTEK